MYRSFYELERNPFDNVPDPDFYYETENVVEAYECLKFSILQEGVVALLTGRDGCGKTLLLRKLLKEVEESHELSYVTGNLHTSEELLLVVSRFRLSHVLEIGFAQPRIEGIGPLLSISLIWPD